MTDIKVVLTAKKENMNKYIIKYLQAIDLLKEYIASPANTTDKIVNNNILPIEIINTFKDIQRGLRGEFTRSQCVELGKAKILNYIESILASIKKDYVNIEEIFKTAQSEIIPNLTIMNRDSDFELLERRKSKYLKNQLTETYFTKKLATVLEPKLIELGLNVNIKEFLLKLEGILAYVRTIDVNNIRVIWSKYLKNKEFLLSNFKNVGNEIFSTEKYTPTAKVDEIDFNTYFKELINKVEIDNKLELTDIDIINRIISILPRTIKVIDENVTNASGTLKTFVETEPNSYFNILEDICKTTIEPYVKTEMTTEDFAKRMKNSIITIDNGMGIDYDLIISVVNLLLELEKGVRIYLYVYQLMNEITAKGTIE